VEIIPEEQLYPSLTIYYWPQHCLRSD